MFPEANGFAARCVMRKFTTILIGGAILAWMAYLSWPVTAETSVRERSIVSTPAPKVNLSMEILEVDACGTCEPKTPAQPSA